MSLLSIPLVGRTRRASVDARESEHDADNRAHLDVLADERARRRIETVIGQLSERFHLERVRARDRWHLTQRVSRKLLSHTVGMAFLRAAAIPTLQLACLLAA